MEKQIKPAIKMKTTRRTEQSEASSAKKSISNSEKHKSKKKAGRLVVRNVSFTATEDDIRKHFEKCGKIRNVTLLRKTDGKFTGCCFIQYIHLLHAQKAIAELNASKIKGRNIAVDWAIEKSRYSKLQNKSNKETEASESKEKP